eukprot:4733322-Amphidinium_carterae.4
MLLVADAWAGVGVAATISYPNNLANLAERVEACADGKMSAGVLVFCRHGAGEASLTMKDGVNGPSAAASSFKYSPIVLRSVV